MSKRCSAPGRARLLASGPALALLLLSCSTPSDPTAPARTAGGRPTLPDYAAPTITVGAYDPATLAALDLIPYRPLARADFRAAAPPADRAPYADKVGALTCAQIYTDPGSRIVVRSAPAPGGQPGEVHHVATVHGARVDARMDRGCSWWNPKDLGLPQAYILQHEQIHFALFEVAARRLNDELAVLMSGWRATAATQAGARAEAERKLQGILQGTFDPLLARNRAFDEDTSMGHRPEAQARWWAKIQAELAATAD